MPLKDKDGTAFLDGDTAPRCISVITQTGGTPEQAPNDGAGGQLIDLPAAFDAYVEKAQQIKDNGG